MAGRAPHLPGTSWGFLPPSPPTPIPSSVWRRLSQARAARGVTAGLTGPWCKSASSPGRAGGEAPGEGLSQGPEPSLVVTAFALRLMFWAAECWRQLVLRRREQTLTSASDPRSVTAAAGVSRGLWGAVPEKLRERHGPPARLAHVHMFTRSHVMLKAAISRMLELVWNHGFYHLLFALCSNFPAHCRAPGPF